MKLGDDTWVMGGFKYLCKLNYPSTVIFCWHLSCDQDHINCALSWQGMQNRVIMTSDNSHLRWGLIKPRWGQQSRERGDDCSTGLSDNKGDWWSSFLLLDAACRHKDVFWEWRMYVIIRRTIQLIVFYGAVRMWHGEVVVLMVELVHSTGIPMSFFNVR